VSGFIFKRVYPRTKGIVPTIQPVEEIEELTIFGNVAHGMPIMDIPDQAFFVNDHLGWHASQLEQVDLLAVTPENSGLRVGQSDKWQRIFLPVFAEGCLVFRPDDDHYGLAGGKFLIILAQLRHVPAAEWSHKAAVENQQDIFPAHIG